MAVASGTGRVLVLFKLKRVEEFERPSRAGFRCLLVAVPGSVRKPSATDLRRVRVNSYGAGTFLYFDASTLDNIWYSDPTTPDERSAVGKEANLEPLRHPLLADNVGKTLKQPERELIAAYTCWIRREESFEHHYLRGPRLYTDLFFRPRYTLFEAKSYVDRPTLRMALGQLLDYQRHYGRHPSLAILLPRRADAKMMLLFAAKRVAVVWRSRGGAFADSVAGALSTVLRLGS